MLGDSLRRRRGRPTGPDPDEGRSDERKPERSLFRRFTSTFSWPRWLLLALVILVGSFGVGYLLATQVLFPRPETAGTGVPIPELYGETRTDAEETLRTLGLALGDVRELKSMATDAGQVLAQDPLPGQQLLPGASVSLGVSAGPPELRIPPLVGLGEATARELLETVGFEVVVRQTRSGEFPAGVVTRAEPAPGTPQRLPARVTIVVSTGRPDSLSDSPGAGRFR